MKITKTKIKKTQKEVENFLKNNDVAVLDWSQKINPNYKIRTDWTPNEGLIVYQATFVLTLFDILLLNQAIQKKINFIFMNQQFEFEMAIDPTRYITENGYASNLALDLTPENIFKTYNKNKDLFKLPLSFIKITDYTHE